MSCGAALRDNFKNGGADGEEILIKKNCRSGKMSYNFGALPFAELRQQGNFQYIAAGGY